MTSIVIHMMTYKHLVCQCSHPPDVLSWVVRFTRQMTKETRLTFRVRSELKKSLEAIAAKEARSVAQICEVILQNGVAMYQKEGTRYLHRLISNAKTKGDHET